MQSAASRTRGATNPAGRRVGYVVAVGVNALGLWISHQLLDWGWPRFLGPDYEELLPVITASFVASMVVNAIFLVADPPWFKALGASVTAAISFVVALRTYQVFPFDFSSYARDWSTLFRVVIVLAIVGAAIATVVNLVNVPREFAGRHRPVVTPIHRIPTLDRERMGDAGAPCALVVYESMFGATHLVADRLAEGLRATHHVDVVPVHDAAPRLLDDVELLVVGGPTHIHGMTTRWSRSAAAEVADQPDAEVVLDPDAEGEGLRDWFHTLPELAGVHAAAFDTRVGSVPTVMSGQASKGIALRLRQHGLQLAAEPESFLVEDDNHLRAGEADRAVSWAASLAASLAAARTR